MPPDIRNFFGGGGMKSSQDATPSTKPAKSAAKNEASKSRGRGKRKVLSDSEEDDGTPPPKKATNKTTPQKAAKKEDPQVEATTASDYFGSKPKSSRANGSSQSASTKPRETQAVTPKATPKGKKTSTPASTRSVRSSTRNKPAKAYVEVEDDDDVPVVKNDDDSGEDIFQAEYKGRGKKTEDDYKSSSDSDEPPPVEEKKDLTSRGKKRKSTELSDAEDAVPAKKANGKAPPPKQQSPKKTKSPKKKGDEPEDQEMQEIFDSIPTVRAPTPPQRDASQKFDWKAVQQRSQPQPTGDGSKEIPEGADNCLAGLTFVFTGILESLGREEGQNLVKRYGGKVTTSPSSKTDYVVLGSDAGPKKLETIRKLGIKTINEDGLFALISKLPTHGGSSKNAQKAEEKRLEDEQKIVAAAKEMDEQMKNAAHSQPPPGTSGKPKSADPSVDDRLWTTKYAPSQLNQVIGNRSQVEKVQNWLRNWRKNAKYGFKKPGPDGSGLYRAVMLHGGPGIGKTTAAHLVANLEGFDVVESNASDTRSKKMVETGLKGVLDTTSLLGYFAGDGKKTEASKKNVVLIMDEVDGMSAGDRGGVGAMAAICRKTNVPIILICNDRRLPKMKPFDRVTLDIPFRKPTTDQVRMRLQTILYREKMAQMVPTNVVNALIEGSGADIRRVINMLSTAKMDAQAMNYDESKKMSNAWEKHVLLKPWDMVQKILGGGMFAPSSKASLNDKIELYFNDHDFASLMLQENYLKTNPSLSTSYHGKERTLKMLELADNAAQSISDGDLCDAMIHGSQQQWSLMPTHAVLSFVRPASFVAGMTTGGIGFTSYLGNNSKGGKLSRMVREIQGHMRLRTSADRHEIRQQYMPVLWERLVHRLQEEGKDPGVIDEIIDLMGYYYLTKEDFDALIETGVGPQDESQVKIATAIKTQHTRKLNAANHHLPFMKASGTLGPQPKSKDKPDLEEAIEESDEDDGLVEVAEVEEEELDLKKDKYVSAPKKKKAAAGKKGGKKGKGKKDDEDEDEEMEDIEEEEKPARGKGKAARGRGKK